MPESLRLWVLCSASEFSVLPVAGGWYDQHPIMLDHWVIIWSKKADHDKREQQKRERENKAKKGKRRPH